MEKEEEKFLDERKNSIKQENTETLLAKNICEASLSV